PPKVKNCSLRSFCRSRNDATSLRSQSRTCSSSEGVPAACGDRRVMRDSSDSEAGEQSLGGLVGGDAACGEQRRQLGDLAAARGAKTLAEQVLGGLEHPEV